MSYCVNCGVELDKTIKECPLCGTEVNNPRQPVDTKSPTSYPQNRATLEPVVKKETAIVLSIILAAPSIGCGVMNFLILRHGFWSLYVIGACLMIWTLFVPPLLFKKNKLPNLVYAFFDALTVILYLYIFVLQFGNEGWYQHIAIPIVILIFILVLFLMNIYDYYKPPILFMTINIIGSIGIFCIGTEIILNLYFHQRLYIFWSAIVMVCCLMIIAPLSIIIKHPKLREEVRRRMHI